MFYNILSVSRRAWKGPCVQTNDQQVGEPSRVGYRLRLDCYLDLLHSIRPSPQLDSQGFLHHPWRYVTS